MAGSPNIVCPSCGQETPEGFPRCANCGAELVTAAAAREERKVVTVLFCDLVGFTGRAESMDPEDVRALLSGYHERVRHELERHGGTVEKFVGDAVMALFGAPVAHEDDPERAVRAALAVRDETEFGVRIGITTGEALIALGARPESGEGMASGDVVNTASRLQGAARENGILVDEATYRATERPILYEDREPIEAKGKGEAIRVYEALEARSRLGVDVEQHERRPLVGRGRELDFVLGVLARVREEREPQLVTLVGVPGIGKSRLVLELLRSVDDDPELIIWRQGRCLPYGDGVAYWAVGEMVKAQAGVLDTDSSAEAVEKLERAVDEVVEDPGWVVSQLRPLVGMSDAGQLEESRVEAFAAWRRFFEGIAEDRPLVLVFEDLHWADDGLLDFVDHLVEWASGVPILIVATTRPELLERRAAWGGGKLNAATLALSPLADVDAARLVADLLGSAVLPAETQAALLARAGGNPLYAEQFAKLFVERGFDGDLPLPENVHGIIAARLDALPPAEKAALQNAAVVGKVFWPASLAALGSDGSLDELLHALDRKEFVRRERRSTVGGQTEYAFRHGLVRDVAYGQIPRARRAESHRRTAEWIEALSERSEDFAELLAHHYSSALELASAVGADLGDLRDRARLALRTAGRRALSLGALPAAARFYSAALELWPDEDSELPDLQLAAGQVCRWLDAPRGDLLLEARDRLLAQGRRADAAAAEAELGFYWWNKGDTNRADQHWDAVPGLLAAAQPSRSSADAYAQMAVRSMVGGRPEEGIERAQVALEFAEQLSLKDVRAHALMTIGTCRFMRGDEGWLTDAEESLALSERLNWEPGVIRACKNIGDCFVLDGQLERGFELQARGLEAALRFGDTYHVRWFQAERADECYLRGRWDEAMALADAFIDEVEGGSPHMMEVMCRLVRALVSMARGDEAGALADSERLVAYSSRDPQIRLPALGVRARVLVELGRPDEVPGLLDEAMDVRRDQGIGAPHVALAAADLGYPLDGEWARRGHAWPAAARAVLRGDFLRAAEISAAMGSRPDEADARLRAARAFVAEGRRAEADEQLSRALAFYRSVGATRYLRQGEALLAKTA